MMWLMPIKTAHRSMLWPGTHRKQGFLPAASCTGSWHVRAAPSGHRRVSERTADLTLHRNTKAILCRCCCFSTLSLTYKTKMYNHTDQPRTLPPDALSLQVFFSLLSVLGGTMAERVAVLFTMCVALIPRSVSVSVLDSLFLSPFLFPPSLSQSQHQPGLFCWALFFYSRDTLSAIQRCVCTERTHPEHSTPGKRTCFRETSLPDSTAVLHISHEQKAIFFPAHCLWEVVQAMNEMTLSVCVLTDEKMIIKGDDGKLWLESQTWHWQCF